MAKILDDLNNQKNAENIFQALLQYLQLCQQIISNYAYYKKHDAIPKQQQDELELATEWLRISLFKLIKLSQANSENTVVPQKQKHETADHYELRLIDWMQSLERYPLFKLAFHNGKIEKTASTTNTQETIDERAKQHHLTSAELAIRFAEHIGQIKTRKKPNDTTLNITHIMTKVVLIIPGETQFTLIPLGPSSFARPRVNVSTPPLHRHMPVRQILRHLLQPAN